MQRQIDIIAKLRQSHQRITASASELERERVRIAYAALGGEDEKAAARLAELNRQASQVETDRMNIESAIATAEEKLAEVQQADSYSKEIERAADLRSTVAKFEQTMSDLDDLATRFVATAKRADDLVDEINKLGGKIAPFRWSTSIAESLFRHLQGSVWGKRVERPAGHALRFKQLGVQTANQVRGAVRHIPIVEGA
jgi:chromosome segregation ATPase